MRSFRSYLYHTHTQYGINWQLGAIDEHTCITFL